MHPMPSSSTQAPNWGAVFSLCACVMGLVTAELLPISLLTPIAAGLRVQPSAAGQAVTVTSLAALGASLLTAVVTRRLDRRTVLVVLTAVSVAGNTIVGFASTYAMLLLGRVLLGLELGGFWSMAAAV
ncbi:MFS transporter, partial [Solirubrobacter sp. CPCC 204708]|nr:MFS transporter [Solirubrobacter deserti]